MKSYLDLVPISAKAHKKQSRMTKLCIILSVFLVTVILAMANEAINCQVIQEIKENGNWHCLAMASETDAKLLAKRKSINTIGIFTCAQSADGVKLINNPSSLAIMDKNVFTNVYNMKVKEGKYPSNDSEVLLPLRTKKELGVAIGDTVNVTVGQSNFQQKVTGFTENVGVLMKKDPYVAIFDGSAYKKIMPGEQKLQLIVRFNDGTQIRNEIKEIKKTYSLTDKEIIANGNLLALLMQGDSNYIQQLYICALVLCLIVLIAGIMMITSSINISVSEKTEFFGMMRCLGASKKQVKRYVLADALGYCLSAVPLGLIFAVCVVWILCAVLRYAAPGIFEDMPVLDVSWISIIFGAVVGVLTVLLAAMSPAKKASKVSPLTAVSGNTDKQSAMKHAANTKILKVETVLGMHHATGSKKNFVLMICSFALSIVLFLGFTVGIDFMNHAIVPIKPFAPDVVVYPKENNKLTSDITEKIKTVPGVTKVYPMVEKKQVPVTVNGKKVKVDIASYESTLFDYASRSICEGNMNSVQNGQDAMLLFNDKGKLKNAKEVTLDSNNRKVKIAAVVSASPYEADARQGDVIIVSEATFKSLVGQTDYAKLNIQQTRFADAKNAEKIQSLIGSGYKITDRIQTNKDGRGAFYSFALFVYGFLAVIALIAVANIVNSVAMSVHSHRKQYGFMRAVGMSNHQLLKMIVSQTLTYSLAGCVAGCIPGIYLNKFLFEQIVTAHWGSAWYFPTKTFIIIVILVMLTSIIAVWKPYKRVRNMSIIKNISAE